jgi:7-carboxy-7-deazaguanine synthase
MKVNEIFYSIQGEGAWSGTPTIFIRTTGCNLRCSFCDTKYAYEQGTEMSIQEILDEIKKYPCRTICLTGGEPLLQKDLQKLIKCLLQKKYRISLEANGSIDIKKFSGKTNVLISLDIKCPSSGMKDYIYLKNISYLNKKDQLKFIIKDKNDISYAKEIIKKYHPRCSVFFQPVWGIDPKKLATWILDDGLPVRVGLQLHKIIWGEKKGV